MQKKGKNEQELQLQREKPAEVAHGNQQQRISSQGPADAGFVTAGLASQGGTPAGFGKGSSPGFGKEMTPAFGAAAEVQVSQVSGKA